ncbi:aspartate aminotransferase family protein [Sulfobacillus harzensis]|uniref:alanine--glyoxylate transaminase n=1 Tax=Sulfobacillus harzensis TaxID=2729629 RepID=A0A7Y0Q3D5_9FIRM|nr:aspartate aminotransferase family protein [Sulfobacillus harzensis]NMP22861.1 aspartate aminotransferase family protein [Sulfobacillus harzensis]
MSDVTGRQREYLAPGVSTYYTDPLVLTRGDGRRVTDDMGRSYLDFFGGILTVSIGHAHPAVTAAVSEQAARLVHTSTLYVTEPMVDLAERLAAITPGKLKKSFFTTSGTEANETAITMAQLATGNQEVVTLRHSYSGRSQVGMGLTGQANWKLAGSGMSLPIRQAHNAYCYRCPFQKTPDTCGLECAKDLDDFIRTSTSGRLAAFLAEPIQGVGGFITPPPAFFQETVAIARKYGALFIDDEVQTGFGRTGKAFGIDHYGVHPDLMTFAKGLANGLPIGATIATDEVANAYQGPTISTFGGNPLSMRAALATLDVMERENLTEAARIRGNQLRQGLEDLSDRFPILGDVRGKGLMQGLEIVLKDKKPAPDLAAELLEEAQKRGLLVGKGGLYGNVIRIAPPLTVTANEVTEALEVLGETLQSLYGTHSELAAVPSTRIQYQD